MPARRPYRALVKFMRLDRTASVVAMGEFACLAPPFSMTTLPCVMRTWSLPLISYFPSMPDTSSLPPMPPIRLWRNREQRWRTGAVDALMRNEVALRLGLLGRGNAPLVARGGVVVHGRHGGQRRPVLNANDRFRPTLWLGFGAVYAASVGSASDAMMHGACVHMQCAPMYKPFLRFLGAKARTKRFPSARNPIACI